MQEASGKSTPMSSASGGWLAGLIGTQQFEIAIATFILIFRAS
jgi:hypothetical protein